MEHHSNILPWRESGATVLTVGQPVIRSFVSIASKPAHCSSFPSAAPSLDACIDLQHLAHQLQHARDMGASIIIGAFAAGLSHFFLFVFV